MGVSSGPPNSLAQAHPSQLQAERAALGAVNYQDHSLAWAGRWQASDLAEPAPHFPQPLAAGFEGAGRRAHRHAHRHRHVDTLKRRRHTLPGQAPRTRLKGIPYFLRMMGEMRVILWRKKASQPWELPGKKPGEG